MSSDSNGSSSAAGGMPIGVSGTFVLRADDTTRPRTLAAQHSYTFDASHAAAADAAAATAAEAAAAAASTAGGAAASTPKPARVTANTTAVYPRDIPRSCPADPALSQLVTALRLAKDESDRWLTQHLDEMKKQHPDWEEPGKRKARDEDEDDEDPDAEIGGEPQGKKAKA